MGRIHLTLPGNAFHSDVSRSQWDKLYSERMGVEAIGASGVPISVSFQGIDYEIFPWLENLLAKCHNIEQMSTLHSHALIPLLSVSQQKWEYKNGRYRHPVSFFGEFYPPAAEFIKTPAFFIVGSETVTYSVGDINEEMFYSSHIEPIEMGINPETCPAINYAGKIGLVVRGGSEILSAFYRFQRDPLTPVDGKMPLETLLGIIRAKAEESNGIIIVPLDIEAPYIGSHFGGEIWEIFFQGIKEYGMQDLFVSLSDTYNTLRGDAVRTRRPHRIMGNKWTAFEIQIRYLSRIGSINPTSPREHLLLSIAGTSDVLSGLYRKLTSSKKKIVFDARNRYGQTAPLSIEYNRDTVDIGYAALYAILDKKPFPDKLREKCDSSSHLVNRIAKWAESHNL